MPPRFLRLLKDPKAWFGLLSGLISLAFTLLSTDWDVTDKNLTGFSQKFHDSLEPLHLPPSLVLSAIAALFALLTIWAFFSALTRRSLLLKPERFIIKAEDPRHLVGREKETDGLAKVCADNPLTVLKGESGAGKSALVKAGLKLKLDEDPHSRLLPLLIDASGLDWDGGLRTALAQAWAAIPKERRQQLGDTAQASPAYKLFERLAKLPELAPKRLLLILDQIDDYFVAQREHFLQEGVVVKPDALERANPDWAALAGLLRHKRVHLLLVCRKDEDMLSALHCVEPAYFPLARIEANLISPLLEQITEDDGHGAVVADPEAGWLQLKARLLRDLAEGGQILPVRLVLALDSLRSFRFLTLVEYYKCGGLYGLERLYVENQLSKAKHALGLDPAAMWRSLELLVDEINMKSRRISLDEFASTFSSGQHSTIIATLLVEFMEQSRLLRRQPNQDGIYLTLYHDYLAQSMLDACYLSNTNHKDLVLTKADKMFNSWLSNSGYLAAPSDQPQQDKTPADTHKKTKDTQAVPSHTTTLHIPSTQTHFDVFISYNSKDRTHAIYLANRLKKEGLKVWFDIWELRPGHPWQEVLENIVETAQAALVLVGKDGIGPWQNCEMRGCLSEFVDRHQPVIPVLLADCYAAPRLPLFLKQFTWIDLREDYEEGFSRLIWGITGKKPIELETDL